MYLSGIGVSSFVCFIINTSSSFKAFNVLWLIVAFNQKGNVWFNPFHLMASWSNCFHCVNGTILFLWLFFLFPLLFKVLFIKFKTIKWSVDQVGCPTDLSMVIHHCVAFKNTCNEAVCFPRFLIDCLLSSPHGSCLLLLKYYEYSKDKQCCSFPRFW